jgi:hypothetical protein
MHELTFITNYIKGKTNSKEMILAIMIVQTVASNKITMCITGS